MNEFLEDLIFKKPKGLVSRLRIMLLRSLGAKIGLRNRLESGRIRKCTQVVIGNDNAFTQGWYLWPIDEKFDGVRIKIGNRNFFNCHLMLDACGKIEIGDWNMFGPDVYITDSNHTHGIGLSPAREPMRRGIVRIGNHCWIGAKAIILSNVELGDHCVVAAGAVVTKSFPAGSVIGGVPAKIMGRNNLF